jgi:hypothetical protein
MAQTDMAIRAKINLDDWDRMIARVDALERHAVTRAQAVSGGAAVVGGMVVLKAVARGEVFSRRQLLTGGFRHGAK